MWFFLTILSAFAWAIINVGNSVLVARFHKSPSLLLWVQTFVSMIFLAAIACVYDVRTEWAYAIVPLAAIAYFGDLLFFWILDHLDISVVNAAWAILAVFMSAVGFIFFHESWNQAQAIGASLVLLGVVMLSFFSRQITFTKTLFLLALLALAYVPAYTMRKAALEAGVPVIPVVFWVLFGRDFLAFIVPLFVPAQRKHMRETLPTCSPMFFVLTTFIICCFYVAEVALAIAYRDGPVSLISVVGNIQPFFVIGLAAVIAFVWPKYAAKEVFSRRSLIVKLGSFSVVFIGLMLLH